MMTKLPEVRLRGRLPDDPEYWEGLSTRIERGAAALLSARRERAARPSAWWTRPSLSPALAACAVVAVAAAWLWVPGPTIEDDPFVSVVDALAPADPIATRLISSSSPPAIGALVTLDARQRGR